MNIVLITVHFQDESGADSLMERFIEFFNGYQAHCIDASTIVCHKDDTITLTFLKTLGKRSGAASLFWNALSEVHFPGKQTHGLPLAPSQLPSLHMDALFMQDLDKELQPGTSALMLIVEEDWSQNMIKVLQGYTGQVYYTPLSAEDSDLFLIHNV